MDATVAGVSAYFCNPGDQAADTAMLVYRHSSPTTASVQTAAMMTGTNDVWLCGPTVDCTTNYTEELSAGLAWLAMPETDKVFAQQSAVRTGVWTNDDTVRAGLGLSSEVAGSSVTIPVRQSVAGRRVYVAWRASDGSAANATIAIDGVVVDTVYGCGNQGSPIRTQNGGTTTVLLRAYALGAVGPHQLVITVQPDVLSDDAFTLLWAGVASGNYVQTGVPHLIAGGIPAENFGLRPDLTSLYDGLVRSVVTQLQGDGLYVQFAATHDVLVAYSDYVDILHPNDAGHQKLATAFLTPE